MISVLDMLMLIHTNRQLVEAAAARDHYPGKRAEQVLSSSQEGSRSGPGLALGILTTNQNASQQFG